MTDEPKKTWGRHNAPSPAELREAKKEAKKVLTDKEKALAHGIVGGLTLKAAFQKAGYAASMQGDDRVLNRPHFVRYLDQMRKRQVDRLDYSVDNLCARLERIYLEAMERFQFGAAANAVMGIGKLMGHLNERSEIELHILSKPAREPTDIVTLSPEEWQRQFTPKRIQ